MSRTILATMVAALLVLGLSPLAAADTGGEARSTERSDVTSRIVGGEDAEPGDYPWMVSLHSASLDFHVCGAALISPEWLLGAAHCHDGFDDEDPSDLLAYVGLHDQTDLGAAEERTIDEVLLHPDWDEDTFSADFALLRLSEPVSDIEPIALPIPADDPTWAPGEDVRTIGWGGTVQQIPGQPNPPQEFPDILQQVVIQRVSDADCVDAYGPPPLDIELMICAGVDGGGQDACQGDSGGPLFVDDSFGFPVQIGVTSFGTGCAAPDFPGVWARITALPDFISDNVEDLPVIAVATSPDAAVAGEPVTLDSTGSRSGPTTDLTYSWDLSDAGLDDVDGAAPEVVFPDDGTYEVTLTVENEAGNTDSTTIAVTVDEAPEEDDDEDEDEDDDEPTDPEAIRITGGDRFETAANVARASFPTGADLVVIATAGDFPDALAASPRAAREGAPLLLTLTESLPSATIDVLGDLGTTQAIIVGGTAAVSDDVEAELEALGITVARIAGDDRIETANEVSRAGWRQADTVYLATAGNYPDALAGAAAGGFDDAPLLLSATDEIPASVRDTITELAPTEIVLLGGTAALSATVETQAADLAEVVTRYGGAERMETAALVAGRFPAYDSAWIATGYDFPDALVAGPGAAAEGGPLLLVNPDLLPPTTAAALTANTPARIVVVGGESAVTNDVLNAAANAAGHPQ